MLRSSGVHVELHEDLRAALVHSTHAAHLQYSTRMIWNYSYDLKRCFQRAHNARTRLLTSPLLTLRALRHQPEVSTERAPPSALVSPVQTWATRATSERARHNRERRSCVVSEQRKCVVRNSSVTIEAAQLNVRASVILVERKEDRIRQIRMNSTYMHCVMYLTLTLCTGNRTSTTAEVTGNCL